MSGSDSPPPPAPATPPGSRPLFLIALALQAAWLVFLLAMALRG